MSRVCTSRLLLAMIALSAACVHRCYCQDSHPRHFLIEHPNVRVDVTGAAGGVSDEQALQALEESARQLRLSIDAGRRMAVDHAEGLPPADASVGVPVDASPGRYAAVEGGDDQWRFTMLPKTLFWQPPLANPSEPRFYVKPSTQSGQDQQETIDTAIGAVAGLYRFSPVAAADQGVQIDVFAVVLSRWTQRKYEVNSDFRYGIPITFAWGNMHGKFGFEHTSSHLGDDAMDRTGRKKIRNVHDDLVLGLDYRFFNALRVYGVYAYPVSASTPVDSTPQRFDWGVEWSRQQTTSAYGQPFAAFDMVLREEQDYSPNSTAQIGWQWLDMDSGRSVRLALELFEGKSTLGQYYLDRERWAAVGAYLDF